MRQALFLLLMLALAPALAETVYISDVLRVGVRALPKSSGAPLVVVTSGAELKVLERQSDYIRVRTAEGVEGWISDSYATSDVPARLRLERVTQERDRVQAELVRLRSTASAGSEQAAQLAARVDVLQEENARLQARVAALAAQLQAREGSYAWLYYALALIALFFLGVYLGVRWDKERVAQRLGGLEL